MSRTDQPTEVMTMEEIERRFDGEWVLVEDPEIAPSNHVIAGRVRWHSPDRDEIDRKLDESTARNWAVLYVGRVPEDTVIIL